MSALVKNDTFWVELPVKEHNRHVVKVVKKKKLDNLETYEVFKIVTNIGQRFITARWVATAKEGHDGQKVAVKAPLVARSYMEEDKVQRDRPTALLVWL